MVKRTIDLVSSALLLLLLLPIFAVISASIVLDSGFPIFYFDKRLGHGGILAVQLQNHGETLRRGPESLSGCRSPFPGVVTISEAPK